MWPFTKKPHQQSFIGHCPNCKGRLVYRPRHVCRNKGYIIACRQCGEAFDNSYSPSHVFVDVQTQRRSCSASPLKFVLRDCQVSAEYVREHYWIVYKLPDGQSVYYHSGLHHYDVGDAEQSPMPIGDAQDLINWLAENTLLGNPPFQE